MRVNKQANLSQKENFFWLNIFIKEIYFYSKHLVRDNNSVARSYIRRYMYLRHTVFGKRFFVAKIEF